ncbi:PIN domain-containing protein [Candidatus Pacearchaeota archaeon]|nr:PIN domain-containing protein [Candidatus Pacearchaeota archaeon]
MRTRVFLDTNVFIYAFEFPDSNSAQIIELLNRGEIEAITSEKVIEELTRYFEKFHSLTLARKVRRYVINTCIIILRNEINEKFLISYDRDFEGIEEYMTPKKFLEQVHICLRKVTFKYQNNPRTSIVHAI